MPDKMQDKLRTCIRCVSSVCQCALSIKPTYHDCSSSMCDRLLCPSPEVVKSV